MSFVISHPDIEGTAVIAERALTAYASKGWVLESRTDAAAGTPTRPVLEQPNRSDSAAKWKTYAVATGMDFDEAMAATRDQLANHFLPAAQEQAAPKPPRKRAAIGKPATTPAAPPAPETDPAVIAADTAQES